MKEFDKEYFASFGTIAERASYLLSCEITTKIDIEDLTPVLRAYIGDVSLPVTARSHDEVIEKAKVWLQEKANQ